VNIQLLTYKFKNISVRSAWLICLTGSLFFFYECIQMNMFNSIDHALGTDLHLSARQLSQLSSIFFYANVVFLIPAGLLLDRFSTRTIILSMTLLCTLGTLLFAHAETYRIAYIARFFTGIGSAFCFLSSMRLATNWFPPQRLAFVTGVLITMAMLGGVVAQTPLALLVENFGWRNALTYNAALGLCITLLIAAVVQDAPQQRPLAIHQGKILNAIAKTYLNRHNVLCALYIALMNFPLALFGVIWGAPFLIYVYHLTLTEASFIISLLFLGAIIGGPLFGWYSDHIQSRRWPMLGAAVLAVAVSLLLFLSLPIPVLAIIFFLLGFISSSQALGFPAIAEQNPPELTAMAVSTGSAAVQAGCAFIPNLYAKLLYHLAPQLPPTGTPLAFASETYQQALWLMPVGFVLAIVLVIKIKELK
jgi:MFS family permease